MNRYSLKKPKDSPGLDIRAGNLLKGNCPYSDCSLYRMVCGGSQALMKGSEEADCRVGCSVPNYLQGGIMASDIAAK